MNPLIEPSRSKTPEELDAEVRRVMERKSRRAFLVGGAATLAAYGGYKWLHGATPIDQLQGPLRRAEEFNASFFRQLFCERGMAPTYDLSRATPLRVNGDIGLQSLILDSWRLQVVGIDQPQRYRQFAGDVDLWTYRTNDTANDTSEADDTQPPDAKTNSGSVKISVGTPTPIPSGSGSSTPGGPEKIPGILLTMADLRQLPHFEMVTQFKCIEGWSQIVRWGGARFSDFLKAYPPKRNTGGRLPKYAAMETPEGDFFSGYDMASLMHPQTMLCYEMGGRPLAPEHGAPLRLAMPLKYGYKQIKQIAKITYTDQKPDDYWANVGYDWYGGL